MTRPGEPHCATPVGLESLAAYWLGELPEPAEAQLEEHFFGCVHCTRRLEAFAGLAEGVRAAVSDGRVSLFVPAAFVDAMKQSGLRMREYALGPGASVNCTIHADDDAVVSRLRAPLAGVRRLDAVRQVEIGGVAGPETRLADIPFDPGAGEVIFIPAAAWLRTMPAMILRERLIAVDEGRETLVGTYTFNHSPSLV